MISYSFTDAELRRIDLMLEMTGDEFPAFHLCVNVMHPIDPAYQESFFEAYYSQKKSADQHEKKVD